MIYKHKLSIEVSRLVLGGRFLIQYFKKYVSLINYRLLILMMFFSFGLYHISPIYVIYFEVDIDCGMSCRCHIQLRRWFGREMVWERDGLGEKYYVCINIIAMPHKS